MSARDARSFLRAFLRERNRDDLLDAAQVALSEIVTNAVLHAHTEVEVSAAILDDGALRVGVTDSSPQLPAQRRYGEQATTGRGMQLVAAVTSACGVLSHGPLGKTVWFEVRGTEDELVSATWGAQQLTPTPTPTKGGGRVLLLGLPPTLWLAARQHHDAVLRELVLYAQEHPDQAPLPERFAQADSARGLVSAAVAAEVGRRARLRRGPPPALPVAEPPFDLSLAVPADAATRYAALQDVLDAAERLAAAGALLARPGLPEIVAVRDWVCEQIIAQHSGVLPAAWRGTSVDLSARDHRAPLPDAWDLREVTDARGGAIAVDDANRIVAVSRPLAQALGWAVEDLVGRRVVALVPPALREAHVAGFSRHLTTGETRVLGVPVQLPVLRADGSVVTCDVLIQRQAATSGRHVYVAHVEPVG